MLKIKDNKLDAITDIAMTVLFYATYLVLWGIVLAFIISERIYNG